jgi:hypothetical protein
MDTTKQGCGSVNLPAIFPLPLSTLTVFGKMSCVALGACNPLPSPGMIYLIADTWAQGPPVSRHGSTNR